MKKIIASLVILCVLFSGQAFANQGSVRRLFSSTAIASTAVVSSAAIPVSSGGYFGVWYQATSVTSTPDLKLEYEMSYNDTSANFVEPASASDIETNLVAETAKVKSISPPPMAYLRVKATGNAGNQADTVLTMYLFQQE